MTFFLWCAIGALAGGLAGVLMGTRGLIPRLEEVAVGVFGAFLGGEFLATMVAGPAPEGGFRMAAFVTAVAGALALLALLKVMRKAVGPMRNGKSALRKR
ncbi:GlsB/YeaQ/YmgE family stress response membrane protein [Ramlibacter pallidus]|uniref:GlsB/YeaQ/YmgE family stress response membrane protein n=1 Tax=Ramlibacter pallidus TaxID=2780087 RepID=UPI001D0D0A30|nr:hypothetical protein [Ramlibacter pallidus]